MNLWVLRIARFTTAAAIISAMPADPLNTDVDPSPAPRRRHWLQYSLRSAMLFVAIICCVVAWLRYHAEQQRRAAARIRALQEYADSCQERYEKIQALNAVSAIGGEVENFAASERDLWKARAELALAGGDKALAVADLKKALKSAIGCRDAIKISPSSRPLSGPYLADEHQAWAAVYEIKLRLVDLSPDALDGAR